MLSHDLLGQVTAAVLAFVRYNMHTYLDAYDTLYNTIQKPFLLLLFT